MSAHYPNKELCQAAGWSGNCFLKVARRAALDASLCGGATMPRRVHLSTYRSSNRLDCIQSSVWSATFLLQLDEKEGRARQLRTSFTVCGSPRSDRGAGRMVSIPLRFPYTTSVRYLSPTMTSASALHLHHKACHERPRASFEMREQRLECLFAPKVSL